MRDEIGTCPNIGVEREVTDRSPFFKRPFHARGEDKAILEKEMKRLCYLGILKEGFSAYSSPVMLISRKLTQDKRVNLAYPLLKDTFTVLGSSKCKVMSMLDLKDALHSLRLTESSKKVSLKLKLVNLYSVYYNQAMPFLNCLTILTYNFPAQALSTVSFLGEGEPPPPISTPWGAYRPQSCLLV